MLTTCQGRFHAQKVCHHKINFMVLLQIFCFILLSLDIFCLIGFLHASFFPFLCLCDMCVCVCFLFSVVLFCLIVLKGEIEKSCSSLDRKDLGEQCQQKYNQNIWYEIYFSIKLSIYYYIIYKTLKNKEFILHLTVYSQFHCKFYLILSYQLILQSKFLQKHRMDYLNILLSTYIYS